MNWNKSLLLFLIPLFASCSPEKDNLFVFNQDEETIDSLHIYVKEKTFVIEELQPNQTQSIDIGRIGGDTRIILQADNEVPMPLGTRFSHPKNKGTLKIMITKDRIVSSSTHSN